MCLAVPAKIIELDNQTAVVEIGGLRKQASLVLLPEASLGDYVLLHAGFAISRLDEAEAMKTLALFDELSDSLEAGYGQ
ncbi:MAG: HypC/HybG/HupF family hydrogenase formation chaperone [Thermoleophilia bacterium]|jgi:hydrogenase expression/formation protein HypC|nr:HypC/HybG/HupF family hydrogenase formation chaperone [Actinomycetota bacterium]MDA8168059.1 HypC/HybG/HupF family hydrogenase formation chaperone [Actinomycetota bacterium]